MNEPSVLSTVTTRSKLLGWKFVEEKEQERENEDGFQCLVTDVKGLLCLGLGGRVKKGQSSFEAPIMVFEKFLEVNVFFFFLQFVWLSYDIQRSKQVT